MRIKRVIIETEDGMKYIITGAQITEASMSEIVDPPEFNPKTSKFSKAKTKFYKWELIGMAERVDVALTDSLLPPPALDSGDES
jgi:hypothetical protein